MGGRSVLLGGVGPVGAEPPGAVNGMEPAVVLVEPAETLHEWEPQISLKFHKLQ